MKYKTCISIAEKTPETIKSKLKIALKNIKKWTKRKSVRSSLLNFPSSDYIIAQPYGNTLHISPWNYPFQLALLPLISSIAAGNTVVIKPSEHSPHTSKLIEEIISSIFSDEYVKVILVDSKVASKLLELRWDYIFFTGSVNVGKIVAKAASKFLTPLTLELGGKNPCIIDKDTDIKLTAKRLIWGKFVNAGQTCIAPDYLIVETSIKKKLIDELILEIERAYGKKQYQFTEKSLAKINTLKTEGKALCEAGKLKEGELKLVEAITIISHTRMN